jgi:hypothetical protein
LSSTSSDKPRSSTAFILDGRFSEVLAIHFDGTLVLSRSAPTGISNSSQTLLTKFSLAFFRGPAVTESLPNPGRQKRPFVLGDLGVDGDAAAALDAGSPVSF